MVFGPEARANVGSSIALRAGLGMEVALRRQVFAVEGAPVAELGTVRGSAEMMLVIVTSSRRAFPDLGGGRCSLGSVEAEQNLH